MCPGFRLPFFVARLKEDHSLQRIKSGLSVLAFIPFSSLTLPRGRGVGGGGGSNTCFSRLATLLVAMSTCFFFCAFYFFLLSPAHRQPCLLIFRQASCLPARGSTGQEQGVGSAERAASHLIGVIKSYSTQQSYSTTYRRSLCLWAELHDIIPFLLT